MQHRLDTPEDCKQSDGNVPDAPGQPEIADASAPVPQLPGFAAQLIGQRMRSMYETIAQEPVPDDLLELVRKLEAKEQSK
ncbi:MAG: NepR family anti-sigma factor [Hyphomicrobium sp.]